MDKVNLFVSYSHVDKDYLPELFKWLNDKNCPQIQVWTDQQISLGQSWDEKIKNALNTADIVLLMVSQDFLDSPYITDNELSEAFKRHEEKQAMVIPIFLRTCMLDRYQQITNLQGYPDMRTPLAEAGVMKDRFYLTIVQKLNEVASAIISEKAIAQSQGQATQDDKSLKANEINQLRTTKNIFVSFPRSPQGLSLRKNFNGNAEAKIKNEQWPYTITPGIEEALSFIAAQGDASLDATINNCIYFIHIAGTAEDVAGNLFKAQYEKTKEAAAASAFNRTILWFADADAQAGLDKLEESMRTELEQIPSITGPDFQGVFDLVDQLDKGKEKKLAELVKTFSPVKRVFMFYDFEKDNDNDLRIQLRKKLQEGKQVVISDPADEGYEEQKSAVEECDAAIIFYGAASDTGWYKPRERVILKAIKNGPRAAFVDGSQETDIERKIDRDVSVNEVIPIKGQKDLDTKVAEFKNSLK